MDKNWYTNQKCMELERFLPASPGGSEKKKKKTAIYFGYLHVALQSGSPRQYCVRDSASEKFHAELATKQRLLTHYACDQRLK